MRQQHVLLSLLCVSVSSTAAPYYLGVKIGKSWLSEQCQSSEENCVTDNPAYGLFAGYHVNDTLALESSYEDLGTFTVKSLHSDTIRLLTLAPKLTFPIVDDYRWYAKAGMAYANTSGHSDGSWFAATGVEYDLRPQMTLRVEYSVATDVNDGTNRYTMNGAAVGIRYAFGASNEPRSLHDAVETTSFIAPAAPQTTPPVSSERTTTYTYDALSFDSSSLNATQQQALRTLAATLNQQPQAQVLIIGHTDSTGSDAYNTKLSTRRAQAAADVLMENQVAEHRIKVFGEGQTRPIDTNTTPAGRAHNRRVEVQINIAP